MQNFWSPLIRRESPPHAKFHNDTITNFWPRYKWTCRPFVFTQPFSFLGFSNTLPARPLHPNLALNASKGVVPRKSVPFWGPLRLLPTWELNPQNRPEKGVDSHFFSHIAKIIKLQYYQNYWTNWNNILYIIPQLFNRSRENLTGTLKLGLKTAQRFKFAYLKIQDDKRQPYWKSIICDISGTVPPIAMKFWTWRKLSFQTAWKVNILTRYIFKMADGRRFNNQ